MRIITAGFLIFLIFIGCGGSPIENDVNDADNQETVTVFRTENGIADNTINDMALDYMANGVWFATQNGISFYSNTEAVFENYGAEYDIPEMKVTSIAYSPTGVIWAGTESGASYLNTSWNSIPNLNGRFITDIGIMSDLSVWFGTSGGINALSSDVWTSYNTELGISSYVTSIESYSDKIWFGTTTGISVYNKIDGNWEYYGAETLPGTYVNVIYNDGIGKIWCGTSGIAVSFDGESWVSYGAADGLTAWGINDFTRDGSGILWTATDSGVFYFSAEKWNKFNLPAGIEGTAVNSILYDFLSGALWIGTDSGAVRYLASNE